MVKYIKDNTGRFDQRPYYEQKELDIECERIITDLMNKRFGKVQFPIPTDVLTVLIEQEAESLDLYANLSDVGDDVEGVTDFFQGKKPRVRINDALSSSSALENRFRTTLTHEYGHVKFHNYLWDMSKSMSLFPDQNKQTTHHCKRETIVNARFTDWMEWQAGYVCGAILMPKTHIKKTVIDFRNNKSLSDSIVLGDTNSAEIITQIAKEYKVSEEAAKIRLLKLDFITADKNNLSLLNNS